MLSSNAAASVIHAARQSWQATCFCAYTLPLLKRRHAARLRPVLQCNDCMLHFTPAHCTGSLTSPAAAARTEVSAGEAPAPVAPAAESAPALQPLAALLPYDDSDSDTSDAGACEPGCNRCWYHARVLLDG